MLVGAGEAITSGDERRGFVVAVAVFLCWAGAVLVWAHRRPVDQAASLLIAAVDIAGITALTFLSGGGVSQVRIAYTLVPITLAFRFRPTLTAAGGLAVVLAYLAQALSHPSVWDGDAWRFVAVQAGFLLWVAAATAALAQVLARRTGQVAALADQSRHLLADALGAEERERQTLAETLHDTALQNLLAARHDLEEVAETTDSPALARAEATISGTARQLRDVVTQLHPLVLEQAGLEAALSAVAAGAGQRGGFQVHVDHRAPDRHPQDRLALSAARELLTNAAKHSRARNVWVRCTEDHGDLVLEVADDGVGVDAARLTSRLADGHIGLAAQRVRIEGAGGVLTVSGSEGGGTTATVRLPGAS